MKPLPIRPQPVPTEPLEDYINRLAEANDWTAQGLVRHIKLAGPDHAATLSLLIGSIELPTFSAPGIPNTNIGFERWGLRPTDWTYRRCVFARAAWKSGHGSVRIGE